MNFRVKSSFNICLAALIFALVGCASQNTKSTSAKPTPAKNGGDPFAEAIRHAAATPSTPPAGEGWKPLFDGKSLAGWKVTEFAGHGPAKSELGLIIVDDGDALSGITCTNPVPKSNYEISLDAMKLDGSDFFCGLTFPVKDSHCSLILGGWGGTVVGISSIDAQDASENETTKFIRFEAKRWYRVRVRVTDDKLECWLDAEKIVDLPLADRKITLRFGEIDLSRPLGIATYQTTAAWREIKLRELGASK